MNYLIRTTIITFGILLGISLSFIFVLTQLVHLFDLTYIGIVGSFVAWPLGGFVAWSFMMKNKPSDDKEDVSYFWIKKFVIMTTIAGTIASPWSFIANTGTLHAFPSNPFAILLVNTSTAFAWPLGFIIGWKTQVKDKPISEKYQYQYYWAKRIIFLVIIIIILPVFTYVGILFQILVPFPIGIYFTYIVMIIIFVAAVRFALRNFRPEN